MRGGAVAWWVALTLGLSACSAREVGVRVIWPPLEPGKAALLVVMRQEMILHAEVIEVGTTPALEVEVPGTAEAVEVYVLEYALAREELGLGLGPLRLGAGWMLPRPVLAVRTEVTPAGAGPWDALEAVPEAFRELRLDQSREEACAAAFSPQIIDFALPLASQDARTALLTPHAPDGALLVQHEGPAYRVTTRGVEPFPALSSTTAQYLGSDAKQNGTSFLRRGDELLRIDSSGAFESVLRFRTPARVSWFDVRPEADRLVVIAMNERGVVDLYDGQSWSHLGDLPVVADESTEDIGGGIQWIRDTGQALLVTPVYYPCPDRGSLFTCGRPLDDSGILWFYDGSRLSPLPKLPSQPVSSFVGPEDRTFVGTLQGDVYELVERDWVRYLSFDSRVSTGFMSSRGLLLGLGRREIAFVHPVFSLCVLPLRDHGVVRSMVNLSNGVVLGKSRDTVSRLGGAQVSVLLW